MYWNTTDDPSDGYSRHWTNAPKEACPECGNKELDEAAENNKAYLICRKCNHKWKLK